VRDTVPPASEASRHDSEIGRGALGGRTSCYYRRFRPIRCRSKTIEDINVAPEARIFWKRYRPASEGGWAILRDWPIARPRWAIMMLWRAVRPEPVWSIIVAGAPLQYWAGVRGPRIPMLTLRPATLASAAAGSRAYVRLDMANSIVAHLVRFREPEPGKYIFVDQQYNLYSKIDTEASPLSWLRTLVGLAQQSECWESSSLSKSLLCSRKSFSTADTMSTAQHRPPHHPFSPLVLLRQGRHITPPQSGVGLDFGSLRECPMRDVLTANHRLHRSRDRRHLGIFVSVEVWAP